MLMKMYQCSQCGHEMMVNDNGVMPCRTCWTIQENLRRDDNRMSLYAIIGLAVIAGCVIVVIGFKLYVALRTVGVCS